MMYCTAGAWKAATLSVRVEKPPVPRVEKVWHAASKALMPAARSRAYSASDRPAYTFQSASAVSAMRGASFSDRAPENSALYSAIPPAPIRGSTAMVRSTTPMPPSQCVKCRQNWITGGSTSTRGRIVAPVVVKPETDSNTASVTVANAGVKK